MIKKYFSSFKTSLAASSIALLPVIASAQEQSAQQKCDTFKKNFAGIFDWVPSRYCSIEAFLTWLIQTGLMLAGVIAVLFIILGGYWYLTSAGNEETAEKGRKTVTNSIIGLVVIIMSFVIVKVITNLLTSK